MAAANGNAHARAVEELPQLIANGQRRWRETCQQLQKARTRPEMESPLDLVFGTETTKESWTDGSSAPFCTCVLCSVPGRGKGTPLKARLVQMFVQMSQGSVNTPVPCISSGPGPGPRRPPTEPAPWDLIREQPRTEVLWFG